MRRIEWALVLGLLLPTPARAVDGVIEINQARALAGGVTPGDAPGFPVQITESGSYRLTGNLTVPLTASAIEIDADDVALDLGGFTIANAGNGLHGISLTNVRDRISVRNGNVRDFDFRGINLYGDYETITGVRSTGNGDSGIFCVSRCRVRDVVSSSNGSRGVECEDGCVVTDSLLERNLSLGVAADDWARVEGCTIVENGSPVGGIGGGISAGAGSQIVSNVIASNGFGVFTPDG